MLISGYILLKFAVGMQKDAVSTTIHFGQDTSSSSNYNYLEELSFK